MLYVLLLDQARSLESSVLSSQALDKLFHRACFSFVSHLLALKGTVKSSCWNSLHLLLDTTENIIHYPGDSKAWLHKRIIWGVCKLPIWSTAWEYVLLTSTHDEFDETSPWNSGLGSFTILCSVSFLKSTGVFFSIFSSRESLYFFWVNDMQLSYG